MVQRYNLATRHKFFRLWYRTRCIQSCFLRRCANDNAVVIDTREDGLGRSNSYSVLVPDREHVRYKKAEGSVDTEPTATAETELAAPVVEVPVE